MSGIGGAGNFIAPSNGFQSALSGQLDASQAYSRGKPVQTIALAPRGVGQAASISTLINPESLALTKTADLGSLGLPGTRGTNASVFAKKGGARGA